MKKILVIGSANADLLLQLPRMPRLGETITGQDVQVNAGGKGLNQAIAVKKLGGQVSFWACLGEDDNGQMLRKALAEADIPFVGQLLPDCRTGLAVVSVVQGDNFILLHPGANAMLTPERIEAGRKRIEEADFVVLQLEIPLESVVKIAEIAKEAGTKVVLNPAPCQRLPDSLYPRIDYLIPNEVEAAQLTGLPVESREQCLAAMQALRQRGAGTVIITLGERGCCYQDDRSSGFLPAVKTEAVDTTSAGDTFIGALCSRLALGEGLEEAARYGTRAAAITVSRSGAARSIPWARELESVVDKSKNSPAVGDEP